MPAQRAMASSMDSSLRLARGSSSDGGEAAGFEQRRDGVFGVIRIEDFDGFGEGVADGRSTGDAIPGEIDAVEEIFRGRVAGDEGEKFLGSAGAFGCAHALAAMHGAAHAGDLAVRIAEERIVDAGIDFDAAGKFFGFLLLFGGEGEGVPHEALRFPGTDPLELLGEAGGIGGGEIGFFPEDGGGLMLTVSVARSAGETEDNDVGLEAADDPDDVA